MMLKQGGWKWTSIGLIIMKKTDSSVCSAWEKSEPKEKNIPENGKEVIPSSGSAGIRIQRCSSCGKLLFVKTEEDCYRAACNACNIQYMQKR